MDKKGNLEHYPEEYITGKVTFFGREFVVTPDVLIPRLETESLVRRARETQKVLKYNRIIDIGCGSGIIGTSLADLAHEIIFLDISEAALLVAEKNFTTFFPEKMVKFIKSNLLTNFVLEPKDATLFLANLPYIKHDDWEHMSPDTSYEPHLALFGGYRTGFELYEELFRQLFTKKYQGTLIIEFGYDQNEIAKKILDNSGRKYSFFTDYSGVERFAFVSLG